MDELRVQARSRGIGLRLTNLGSDYITVGLPVQYNVL